MKTLSPEKFAKIIVTMRWSPCRLDSIGRLRVHWHFGQLHDVGKRITRGQGLSRREQIDAASRYFYANERAIRKAAKEML